MVLSVDGRRPPTPTTSRLPTAQLGDPLQARTQRSDPRGRRRRERHRLGDLPGRKPFLPDADDSFQSQAEQPTPQGGPDESSVAARDLAPAAAVGGPDESKIAATIAAHCDTGPQARAQAWQEKLDSMTPQQREQAFGGR